MPELRWPVGLFLVAVLLGGCADGGGAAEAGGDAAAGGGSFRIEGVVVDEAVRPLAGANVTASGPSGQLDTATDASGLFAFEGLAAGAYVLSASKPFYSAHQQVVTVGEGVDAGLAKFQLTFEAASVPFASVYKYEGFHECGLNWLRLCSNVNILTGIVLCQYPQAPCVGNVTSDRSVFFQPVDGTPDFIQAELAWEATTDAGRALNFYIGGGNVSELQQGTASTYNGTGGPSPLMLRITNHEGPGAWCVRNTDCPVPDTLNQSRIGAERVLLGQVDAGPTYATPTPMCEEAPGWCGQGASAQQPFTMFTTVFYGYEPPGDWLFTATGAPPPPPSG